MSEIKEFFNDLNRQIRNSNNRGTLKFIHRKGKRFKEEYNLPHIDSKIKKQVNKEYKKSLRLISKRMKNF